MKDVTLARLGLDGRHVTGLSSTLGDARLSATLKAAGIPAKLYNGKPEGRVVELARQLARMRTDAYFFSVSDETAGATVKLVDELHRLRSNLAIFFWKPGGGNHDLLELMRRSGEVITPTTPEDAIIAFLKSFAAENPSSGPVQIASPYINGVLTADDLLRFGLTADQPLPELQREIDWLEANPITSDGPLLLDATGLGSTRIEAVCQLLQEACSQARFMLRFTSADWSDDLIDHLLGTGIVRLQFDGNPTELLQKVERAGVQVEQDKGGGEEASARAGTYARNGCVADHTGLYFDQNPSAAIYHLGVPLALEKHERRAVYAWASNDMAIRSAAVLTGPEALVMEHLSEFESPVSEETRGWPKHVYAIARSADSGSGQLFVDGMDSPVSTMRYVPLSSYDEENMRSGELTFITIRDAEDVIELERRFSSLHSLGHMRVPHPSLSVHFENSCRWLSLGGCKLSLLRRLQVDEAQRITACRDSGEIGSVGNTYDQLLVATKQNLQLTQVHRGCATCAVRDQCSQCVHLPQSYGGRYCELRESYPHASLYFEVRGFIHVIAPLLKDGAHHFDLRVSAENLPLQHYAGRVGVAKVGARPILLSLMGMTFAWWRGTRRLLRLSEPLALMTEAWWAGADVSDIVDHLSDRFQVDAQTALSSLDEGMNKLLQGGVVNA